MTCCAQEGAEALNNCQFSLELVKKGSCKNSGLSRLRSEELENSLPTWTHG